MSIPHSQRLCEFNVNLTVLHLIAAGLKAEQPRADSFHRAIDRALEQLAAGRSFTLRGEVLAIQSASRAWLTHTATPTGCSCEAQQGVCWHRAAAALLVAYDALQAAASSAAEPRRPSVAAAAPTPNKYADASYEEVVRLCDELFE